MTWTVSRGRGRAAVVAAAPAPDVEQVEDEPVDDSTSVEDMEAISRLVQEIAEPLANEEPRRAQVSEKFVSVRPDTAAFEVELVEQAPSAERLALELLRDVLGYERSLTASAIATMGKFAERAPDPSPQMTFQLPDVTLPAVTVDAQVHVPEQPAPEVHLHQEPMQVDVHVPEQRIEVNIPEQAPAEITVNVPEQQVTMPDVHVDVHVPEQKQRAVRVEFDDEGHKRYVTEEV